MKIFWCAPNLLKDKIGKIQICKKLLIDSTVI